MKKAFIVATSLSLLVSGCSLFAPHSQNFSARCSEPDADLFINSEKFQGHGTTSVKRNGNVSIMCTKPGFNPSTATVAPTISGTGIADAIGTVTILLPGLGFLSPGAWRLTADSVNIIMDKAVAP
jgi:hypothetical protein